MTHSQLPPSRAARRMICPGSKKLEEQYPQKENSYTREGTAAHWVAEQYLKDSNLTTEKYTPKGEIITQEMLDGAKFYKDYLKKMKFIMFDIETKIKMDAIYPGMFGTCDFWGSSEKVIHIMDYKFGFKQIEAEMNWQLLCYAIGVYTMLNYPIRQEPIFKGSDIVIKLHVIQPRSISCKISTWEIPVDKLEQYFNMLRISSELSMLDNPALKVSEQCQYCSARAFCPELQNSALSAIEVEKYAVDDSLIENELGNELRILKRFQKYLDYRTTALEEEAIARIQKGEKVPFFMLDSMPARMTWSKPQEEVKMLGELLEINLVKPEELLTPRQAIDAGVSEDLMKNYSERKGNSFKLKEITAKDIKKLIDS